MVVAVVTPRSPIAELDRRTGNILLTREGYRFLDQLNTAITDVAATLITQAITNGVTGQAPSSDAVFDALALKQGLLTNSAGLAAALSDETGTGPAVFASGASLTAPVTTNYYGFPATQSASSGANDLDDYEEGTFTPGLQFGGAAVSMAGTFNGTYTKIGREVCVNIRIILTAKGSSTGSAIITGLPFSPNADAAATSGYYGSLASITSTPVASTFFGGTTVLLYNSGAASASQLSNTNFSNTSDLSIAINYVTT